MSARLHPAEELVATVVSGIDRETQEQCTAIADLCHAALAELAPDLNALCRVRRLLLMIDQLADGLQHSVNAEAERLDANHVDQAGRIFRDRMKAAGSVLDQPPVALVEGSRA